MVISSRFGPRYAAGLFEERGTTMVVSRGLGFEGGGIIQGIFRRAGTQRDVTMLLPLAGWVRGQTASFHLCNTAIRI